MRHMRKDAGKHNRWSSVYNRLKILIYIIILEKNLSSAFDINNFDHFYP